MATQSVADLSVDIKVQGLAGVKGDLDKLQSSFKRASSEAERVQRSLTSGMQQARTGVSQLSTSAAQAQRSIANMGTAFRAANDNVGRLTPRLEQLKSSVDGTNASMEREVAQLRRLERESKRTERAQQNLSNTKRRLQADAGALTSRLAGLVASYVSLTTTVSAFRNSLAQSRELITWSAQTGVAIERLGRMEAALSSLNGSFTGFGDVLAEFDQRVRQALRDPISEAAQAIRALGIQVQDADGSIRTLDQLLPQIAERFARWQDGADKTAIAMALLGQRGKELIPVLNRGGLVLNNAAQKAEQFKTNINPQLIEEFDKALGNLANKIRSDFNNAIEYSLPGLTSFVERFGQAWDFVADKIAESARLTDELNKPYRLRDLRDELARLQREGSELNALAVRYYETLERAQGLEMPPDNIEEVRQEFDKTLQRMKEVEDQIYKIETAITRLEVPDWQKWAAEVIPTKPAPPLEQTERFKQMAEEMQQFLQAEAQFAQEIALQRTGLIEHMILTEEQHARAVEQAQARIREAYGDTLQAQMMITEMQRELQRQHQEAILDTAQMAARTLTQLFPKSKAAAVAEGIMNTAVGVTRALRDVPWPLNWIQAGLVAAAGAAQIASIRSANLSGSGSLPRTPTTGGSTSSSQPAAPPSGALIIQMPRGGFWSNDAVAELIERINTEVKNGRTLISTQTVPF